MEFDKDGLRLWARPSEELGAIEVFISFINYATLTHYYLSYRDTLISLFSLNPLTAGAAYVGFHT